MRFTAYWGNAALPRRCVRQRGGGPFASGEGREPQCRVEKPDEGARRRHHGHRHQQADSADVGRSHGIGRPHSGFDRCGRKRECTRYSRDVASDARGRIGGPGSRCCEGSSAIGRECIESQQIEMDANGGESVVEVVGGFGKNRALGSSLRGWGCGPPFNCTKSRFGHSFSTGRIADVQRPRPLTLACSTYKYARGWTQGPTSGRFCYRSGNRFVSLKRKDNVSVP